jgi:hypothetical protein
MRKLLAAPILLTFLVVLVGAGAAQAAPDVLKCAEKLDVTKPTSMNCLSDEIFILNGGELVSLPTTPPGPAAPLVNCADKPMMPGVKDSRNCFYGNVANYLTIEGLELAAAKAVELMKAKVPQLPEWDEIVVFGADFGPTPPPAPLFYRAANAAIQPINPVAGIGLGAPVPRDPAKPYIGIISAGNTKTIPTNPAAGQFGPCGTPPRRPAIDDPAPQTAAALCAPGLHNYFDSLAQATANLYGPYLNVDAAAHGGTLWSMPAIKTTLVSLAMGTVVMPKIMGGPATNVWNGLLNTRGSLLGGNTFADNGNGTWSVTRPPAFQGVSAPLEGTQVPRFQPIDLYAMGFLPSSAVPPIQSFMHAAPGNVYQPAGLAAFNAAVGPAMGTRVAGVSLRGIGGAKPVPKLINFGEVIGASGGERNPPHAMAPQAIRQLWVMVTKPEAIMDIVAGDGGAKKEDQQKDQPVQLANLQKYRRAYSSYFYTLTGYRGRVVSTFEGNVDDVAVFEFGGARDDLPSFQPEGSLKLVMSGPEEIPNSGGKQLSVLRVTETNGADGRIRFNPAVHNIRIEGKQDIGSAPNNILTVRMRIPSNPQLLAELKKEPNREGGFYATLSFEGAGQPFNVKLPKSDQAFLVPDGKFRNYSVNLSLEGGFTAGTWTSFSLVPSNRPMRDIEIEFIKIGFSDNVKDADKNCLDADQADGWLDVEDNCAKLFNPAQEDGNNDGIGDACEDYDGDNRLNSCDNCPTTTNTSQRDANGNKIGDACDGSKGDTCFFQEATIAGAGAPSSALLWVAAATFGVMVGGAVRRRRRR